jgi:hypothetical protein
MRLEVVVVFLYFINIKGCFYEQKWNKQNCANRHIWQLHRRKTSFAKKRFNKRNRRQNKEKEASKAAVESI